MGRPAEVPTSYPWLDRYPDDVDWHAPLDSRPLPELFDEAMERFADRPCCDFLGKKLTYRAIADLTRRAAAGFQAMGVGPGVRVGLLLPNTPYYVVCFHAVLKCGGVVVNFNPLYAEREIAHQIEDSGVELMVTLDLKPLVDKLDKMLVETRLKTMIVCRMTGILPFPQSALFPIVRRKVVARPPADDRHVPFDRLIANDGTFAPVAMSTDELAVVQYTGGTTGTPKGALLSHANIAVNIAQGRLWFPDARPGQEAILAILPYFHVFGMTVVMNLALTFGAEMVLLPRFDIDQLMKTIRRTRPTLFPAVPTIFNAIINHKDCSPKALSSLKMCFSGGAPLPVEVKQRFEAATGATLVEGYGLTETAPLATANPLNGLNKPGSIGVPFPGTVVEVVSLDDGETVLPTGERGEICISGPQVMSGYWQQPEETERAMLGGRFHTGDVGYIDEDGYTFIVDRIKDLIIASGFNIYPRNIEEAIYLHPAVRECVVAGIDDAYRGQTVKAYLALNNGKDLTLDSLVAFLKDKLSPIEMPKHLEIRDELPKTMVGKLSRKALLEEEAARHAKEGD